MADPSGYLPSLLGPVVIAAGGVAQTPRPTINFVGCTGADNPTFDRLDITPPAGGGGSSLPVNRPVVEKAANYTLVPATDYEVVYATFGGFTATLPASPAAGDEYMVSNGSNGNITVAGNGNTILGNATFTVAVGQSITFRKSVSAIWVPS